MLTSYLDISVAAEDLEYFSNPQALDLQYHHFAIHSFRYLLK